MLLGLVGWRLFAKKQDAIPVQTEKVSRRNLTEVVVANGTIVPVTEVNISPEVSGEIDELPVVNAEDLKSQYLFSKHELMRMLGNLGVVALIIYLVFSNQKWIVAFLSGTEWKSKVLAAGAVFLFVPAIAFLYSNVTRSLMKLIRME